jgi:hypothetical protein
VPSKRYRPEDVVMLRKLGLVSASLFLALAALI